MQSGKNDGLGEKLNLPRRRGGAERRRDFLTELTKFAEFNFAPLRLCDSAVKMSCS